ncbi:3-carboxy-cis,cis-muconate cycloisomerase [Paracoccus isoporae]|uniref:3-carboxy-cis,cis-muconate cycloisomerase n=1 Tax=Paracoccus isoporae TaxID=591205 RepID=A0A1G6U0Q7_9RHOB|nr:lyase family protein [Paracoccus isoporae]SDD34187.1 3-carboxy-cis,cis-muconate cycloisomerase [Paracoccus isoporae]
MVTALLSKLLGDAEMAEIMGDASAISAMLRVEVTLARGQARLGMIPEEAAQGIAAAADTLRPDPAALAEGVAQAGIAAQPVIAALKAAAGDNAGWVHFGATSQDIVDTALALQLQQATALLDARLDALCDSLAAQAEAHAEQVIPAHTRFQIAAPTTLGAKIAVWHAPLARQRQRLAELRPRLLRLSLFGAAGTSAALGPKASELREAMAEELGLAATETPWHATRDTIAELGSWLSLLTGALGKIGADLVLLTQSEVASVAAGTGGGSSTMPQKSNPVAAETLVTLARLNAGSVSALHQSLIHAHERDGSALEIEWAVLPDMLERAAAALCIAGGLVGTLRPDPARIAAGLAADRGMMMAEAAGFLLSRDMPRPEALTIVGAALQAMQREPALTLADALTLSVPDRDWARLLAPENHLGDAVRIARSITIQGRKER